MYEMNISETSICPLCGKPNMCEMVKKNPQTTGPAPECWCTALEIPAGLLERIPADKRGKACVCRDCVEAYKQELHPPSITKS
jgi:hypothetical protein